MSIMFLVFSALQLPPLRKQIVNLHVIHDLCIFQWKQTNHPSIGHLELFDLISIDTIAYQ